MPRDYRVYLEDVLEAVEKIRSYTAGLSFEAFRADRKTIDAVARNLEVTGEAVKGVPEEVRARYPEVDWKRISGLRDILIHQYFGIDLETVWDILQNKLLVLEQQVRRILQDHGRGSPT